MTMPQLGEFCWNELATADVKKAKEFYGSLFGWEFTEHKMGNMTYTMIKNQDKDCGGIWEIPSDQREQIPPHWMTYVMVKDVAGSLDIAKQHGATVVKEITQAGEMGRFAIIVDPTGAHIALWETLRTK